MNITIPDIPESLNPHGWEVEVSSIGECKEGDWPFYLSPDKWYIAGSKDDDVGFIRARLIEPRYMFEGELKKQPENQDCICLRPEQPANLPVGHKAYPVIHTDRFFGIETSPLRYKHIQDCHNGMCVNGLYLYGWCSDDAFMYTYNALCRTFTAKWALFRPVETSQVCN